MPIKDQGIAKSRVRIERDVWLGTKVTVCRGVMIGEGSVVGANAVVTRDLPAYAVAVGVPARVMKDRRHAHELTGCAQWTTSTAAPGPRVTGWTRRFGGSRPTRTARPTPTSSRSPLPHLPDVDVYLKDESTHPTGSLKHRLARSLFLYALCNGEIARGHDGDRGVVGLDRGQRGVLRADARACRSSP